MLLATLLLGIYATLSVARTLSNALRDAGLLRLTVGASFALATLGVVALVFRNPALRHPRTLFLLVGGAAVYALVVWPMESPEEKLHFIEYGAVAVLWFLAWPRAWSTPVRFVCSALSTLACGWLDEGIQALLPTRHYDLRDVGFNALAGLIALTLFTLAQRSSRAA